MKNFDISDQLEKIRSADLYEYAGTVTKVIGLTVECLGLHAKMGDICKLSTGNNGAHILAEVVGFKEKTALLMPLGELSGVGQNNHVISTNEQLMVPVGPAFLGRVIDAFANPIDDLGPIAAQAHYAISNAPPNPLGRKRIKDVLPLGVRAISAC